MEKSNGKAIYSSNYYFEPINKYHNLSITHITDLTTEKEHFMDIFLVNKNQHKITINEGLIGFFVSRPYIQKTEQRNVSD